MKSLESETVALNIEFLKLLIELRKAQKVHNDIGRFILGVPTEVIDTIKNSINFNQPINHYSYMIPDQYLLAGVYADQDDLVKLNEKNKYKQLPHYINETLIEKIKVYSVTTALLAQKFDLDKIKVQIKFGLNSELHDQYQELSSFKLSQYIFANPGLLSARLQSTPFWIDYSAAVGKNKVSEISQSIKHALCLIGSSV
jgi:hypothetical protein